MDFFMQYFFGHRRHRQHLGRIDIGTFRHHRHHHHFAIFEERHPSMSVSPPTQPIFTLGTTFSAPLSFFDTSGVSFPASQLASISAAADNPAVTTSVSADKGSLLASISAAGVSSVITVTATDSFGDTVTGTVTISDGAAVQHLGSIQIGTFVPVPPGP